MFSTPGGAAPDGPRPRSLLRSLLTVDAVVLVTLVGVALVWRLRHVLVLVAVAVFVAAVLEPAVQFLRRRGMSRGLAVTLVVIAGLVVFAALGYLFVPPVVRAGTHFAKTLPDLVTKAEHGRGAIGRFIREHHWAKYVKKYSKSLQRYFSSFSLYSSVGQSAISVARSTVGALVNVLLVVVLALFTLLEAPRMMKGALGLMSEERSGRYRRIADEALHSVTGYVLGKLATSILFGVVIFAVLKLSGASYASVLALWVGLVDLLPLVGGLLAGIVVVPVALAHSLGAAVATLVVFLVYQQVENHFLNPIIMKRTMSLNPLWTLLAVLFGANLLGIVGALTAIPIAGVIQVFTREAWLTRRQQVVEWGARR